MGVTGKKLGFGVLVGYFEVDFFDFGVAKGDLGMGLEDYREFLESRWSDKFEIFETYEGELLFSFFRRRIPERICYFNRLVREIELIRKNKFVKVFQQVRIILELAEGIPHVVRGSAGSSLVCYLMKITNFDPIVHQISLARFMSTGRVDFPDIDIDFPWNRRDQIFRTIDQHWSGQVARISNHIYYQEKSSLKEAIREEGYRKFIPRDYSLEEIFPDQEVQERVRARAKELIGQMRCYSLHCGGIIIFDQEVPSDLILKDYLFDRKGDKKGLTGKQIKLNKDEVEDHGLIKIDILSNRGLGQLWEISQRPIEDYPDDPLVYQLLARGDNLGIVYAESRAMRKIFVLMKVESLAGIAEGLALIRPAASRGDQKSSFLRDYSPLMRNRDDYIIYDDDAIQYIQRMISCNESWADIFRKAFAKNRADEKGEFKRMLRIRRPEMTEDERKFVFEQLERLQQYSFCKSHAYSYAQLVYALAYQKHHRPREFWLSALNHCNSAYRKWVHLREAQVAGVMLVEFGRAPWRRIAPGSWLVVGQPLKRKKKGEDELGVGRLGEGFEEGEYDERLIGLGRDLVSDFLDYGYWLGQKFLPGMFYREEQMTRNEYHLRKLGRRMTSRSKKDPNEVLRIASFRGIIAIGRPFKSEASRGRGSKITFLTIGVANGEYRDLVLWGHYPIGKFRAIEGFGLVKDGEVSFVEVMKFSFVFLRRGESDMELDVSEPKKKIVLNLKKVSQEELPDQKRRDLVDQRKEDDQLVACGKIRIRIRSQ